MGNLTGPFGSPSSLKEAITVAKVIGEFTYKYLSTPYYGKVGVLLGLTISFIEAIRIDEWQSMLRRVITSKNGRRDTKAKYVIDKTLKIINITEDIVGFPQIDLLEQEEFEDQGISEDNSILLVKRGAIEALPFCEEKGCILKATEVLADIASEFQGLFSKALIHIELEFSDENKAVTFRNNINEVLKKELSLDESNVKVHEPYGRVLQIYLTPFHISFVRLIEEELYKSKMKQFKDNLIKRIKKTINTKS